MYCPAINVYICNLPSSTMLSKLTTPTPSYFSNQTILSTEIKRRKKQRVTYGISRSNTRHCDILTCITAHKEWEQTDTVRSEQIDHTNMVPHGLWVTSNTLYCSRRRVLTLWIVQSYGKWKGNLSLQRGSLYLLKPFTELNWIFFREYLPTMSCSVEIGHYESWQCSSILCTVSHSIV